MHGNLLDGFLGRMHCMARDTRIQCDSCAEDRPGSSMKRLARASLIARGTTTFSILHFAETETQNGFFLKEKPPCTVS
jgi:hypothetical protein